MDKYHKLGWKIKKIAEDLGVTEETSLRLMNVYLHDLYKSNITNQKCGT